MPKTETAYFAAGCFWHVEGSFMKIPGVIETEVGYMGGDDPNPSYEAVCSDKTGHAETTKVVFDPERVTYDDLLKIFFENHDPTTKDRQGLDVGTQYRSAIFYADEGQKEAAVKAKEELERSGKLGKNVVTEIAQAKDFYKAEDYHQKYYKKMGIL